MITHYSIIYPKVILWENNNLWSRYFNFFWYKYDKSTYVSSIQIYIQYDISTYINWIHLRRYLINFYILLIIAPLLFKIIYVSYFYVESKICHFTHTMYSLSPFPLNIGFLLKEYTSIFAYMFCISHTPSYVCSIDLNLFFQI